MTDASKPTEPAPPARAAEGSPAAGEELVILGAIAEGTARSTGQEFFRSLVRHLAQAIDVPYAFVAELAGALTRVRTLAYWFRDSIRDNVEFDLAGTPCQDVIHGDLCYHPQGFRERFPQDKGLVDLGIESYLGVPLRATDGSVLGCLAVFDARPMPADPRRLFVCRIFADRAASELERLRYERRLQESEERYRELREEAPSAYVALDAEGRLQDLNRQAVEHLGYPAGELLGRPLLALFADTPAGRPRAEDVFRRARAGEEIRAAELEMRRRDGGPLWVSLWMKPAAGPTARCSWVDITARVRAEAERVRLERQYLYLREEIKSVHNFEEIVGQSPPLRAVLDKVRLVAPTDTTVLILGETGTGKELIARALHARSRRRDKPLIKVNCAALPAGRVESELFGHEQGAFTGAVSRHVGRFELAHGGTLFLDEVGEVPLEVQVKLLRVLQERAFERVGGTVPIKVNVRVLAASNRDLRRAREEKGFREDLYYRLSVFPIQLPPLRDRREDIPLLVHFLVNKFAPPTGKRIDHVSPATMERLTAYAWPGNVRELENVIERAILLTPGPVLEISPDLLGTAAPLGAAPLDLATLEKNHIRTVLDKTKWVIDGPHGAARLLGLHPNTLRSRLKRLGLQRPGPESA